MKETKEERDEQLRIMEGVLQAKETIIEDLQFDIKMKDNEILTMKDEISSEQESLNRKEQRLNEKELKIAEMLKNNESVVYIESQWGNNVIITNKFTSVITQAQWGSNIVFPTFLLPFKFVINMVLDFFLHKNTAEKYKWNKIEIK